MGSLIRILAILVLFMGQAWSVDELDREEQRRRAREILREQQDRQQAPRIQEEDVNILPFSNWRPQPKDPEHCWTLKQVDLLMPSPYEAFRRHFQFLQHKLDGLKGLCFDRGNLAELLEVLNNELLLRGYSTTRLGLLEGDVQAGHVRLQLLPGFLGKIRNKDPEGKNYRHVFPLKEGDLFNIRALEHGLEQIKRIPSLDVSMDIEPGEDPLFSDVVLDITASRPVSLALNHDNNGSLSTGKHQAGATLAYDDPLGLADLFSLNYNTDVEQKRRQLGQESWSLSYSLPWQYWTVSLAANHHRYHQTFYASQRAFISRGESITASLKADRLLFRDQNHKGHAYCRLGRRFSHSYMDDVEIEVQRRRLTSLECGLLYRRYLGKGQMDIGLSQRNGLGGFGAMSEFPIEDRNTPRLRYRLYAADFSFSYPWRLGDTPGYYSINARTQRAGTPLYGSEHISIGGLYTVRGFSHDHSLSAGHGWYIRQDVGISLGQTPHQLYLGFDTGRVWDRSTSAKSLVGGLLGLRGSFWQRFSYELYVGRPLDKPKEIDMPKEVAGFNLNVRF